MDDKAFVRLTMQEVGPRDDRILQVLQTGDESWAVRFEEVDVLIELDPETRRLMFSCELGLVPEERREEVYQLLLTYSLLWRETGGLRMALDADNQAIQLVDLHCSSLTTELLAIVLHNLEERTLLWREFIAGGAGDHSQAVPPPASDPEYPMIPV
jgi:hypothetical protein